jgi:hypothetical protein
MISKGFSINNEETIREITTFVKHTTTAGNVRYAADVGHDDTVMTIVNSTSIFKKNEFREMVEEWSTKFTDRDLMSYINGCLKNIDYVEGVDYGQVLKVRRNFQNRNKNNGFGNNNVGNWFGQ